MTTPQSINALSHIPPVLDQAVELGEVTYELPTHGLALRWRLEAYKYRSIVQASGVIKYDRLILRIATKSQVVLIQNGRSQGILKDSTGNVVLGFVEEKTLSDPLLEEAMNYARKQGITNDGTDTGGT